MINPYLIPNMQQAYTNLGLNSNMAVVNNLYVRFLPSAIDQLAVLDSTMEAQGLELFDTPVNYDVTYEGDYYQDPSLPDEQITSQYAVVPPNFQFPSGIQYQTLAQINIPGDNYTAVETEAERLASVQDSLSMKMMSMNGNVQPYIPHCDAGLHWDYNLSKCVPNNCPPGYQWNGTTCVPIPPPPPPAPAADAAIPAGYIYVHDTNLPSIASGGSDVPLRKVRMVARRWFKIDRVFTDDNGHFVFNKKFKHKVRIIEKFKNSDAYIYGVRGARLWQMLFPIKRTLGIFSGNKSNLMLYNNQGGPINSKANRYWAAATTHNVVQEHKDYAKQFGFSAAPTTLNIYITNWAVSEGLSSTALFHKRFLSDLPASFFNTFLVSIGIPIAKFFAVFARVNVDMAIDYHTNLTNFKSDWLKETVYHEMSHASQYSKLGTTWYSQFVNAELAEIVNYPIGQFNPYGMGTSPTNSPIIALGEAWGYHMGHFLADQRYGVNASMVNEAWGNFYPSSTPPLTAHPYIDALEYFKPSLTSDPFHWIPKGLMYDLIDNGEPPSTGVIDQVSGFTIAQIFAALQSDVTSVPAYKARLIQQNPGNQTTQITTLFASYDY